MHCRHNRNYSTNRISQLRNVPCRSYLGWNGSRVCSHRTSDFRAITNLFTRGLIGTVPVYLSEISAPRHRGLIGGISGCGISFGTMMSNWVGFACGYAPYGPTQWRLPLGLQIPFGIILFVGLLTFMPDSPRQLVRDGQIEKARLEFIKIRRDLGSEEVHQEFAFMQTQIEYEMQREIKSYREIWRLFKHRVLVAVAVQTMTSLTGTNVISYYQSKNASPWIQHQADSFAQQSCTSLWV